VLAQTIDFSVPGTILEYWASDWVMYSLRSAGKLRGYSLVSISIRGPDKKTTIPTEKKIAKIIKTLFLMVIAILGRGFDAAFFEKPRNRKQK
jgi:hypothetical protein